MKQLVLVIIAWFLSYNGALSYLRGVDAYRAVFSFFCGIDAVGYIAIY